MDESRAKSVQDLLGSDAPAAADLKGVEPLHTAAQTLEQRRLVPPLERRPDRVVHEELFGPIQLHP